jgi:hypothetical protein
MMLCRLFYIPMVIVLLLQCSYQTASGPEGEGNGSETTARGIIVDSAGAPVPSIPIQMIPSFHNPVLNANPDAEKHAMTDERGEYFFEGIGEGTYNFQAGSASSGFKAFVKGVEVTGEKVTVAVSDGKLEKTASAQIDLSGMTLREGDYLYIPGTDVFTIITAAESSAGQAVLSGIPTGIFTDINYVSASDSQITNILKDTLEVKPGDTLSFAYAAWKHSAELLLNTAASGAGIQENVYCFPVLVRLNERIFNFSQARSDGGDIRFAKPDGTPLVYEIERWNPEIKRAEIWGNCDTIHGNDTTHILMYWGNPEVSSSSDGAAVFDTANGFVGVWHLNEDPSAGAGSIKDRSSNAFHATPVGTLTASNSIEGAIGKALALDGKDDYLNAGNVLISSHYSIGLWVYLNTADYSQRFVFKDSSYTLWYDRIQASIRMEHMVATSQWQGLLQNGGEKLTLSTGAWRYLTGTFDGSMIRVYENGTEMSKSSVTAVPVNSSADLLFSKSWYVDYVSGSMDEIRIERTPRSADWIRLCYMNQREDNKLILFR